MVGVALMVMVIVCVIYSTTATTMFSQLGMSNTLQAMDQVSKRLSDLDWAGRGCVARGRRRMEDRGSADSRQSDSSLRCPPVRWRIFLALLLLDEYGNPVLGLPSAEQEDLSPDLNGLVQSGAHSGFGGDGVFPAACAEPLSGRIPWVGRSRARCAIGRTIFPIPAS